MKRLRSFQAGTRTERRDKNDTTGDNTEKDYLSSKKNVIRKTVKTNIKFAATTKEETR